jgi:hypothetical protein
VLDTFLGFLYWFDLSLHLIGLQIALEVLNAVLKLLHLHVLGLDDLAGLVGFIFD